MKIIESPREGMQGRDNIIPLKDKIEYIQSLLKVGFEIVDVGSFVSHKLVPQMAETSEIIENLDLSDTYTKLMVLVVNNKGIEEAASREQITYLSFPFSISPVFLKHNLNTNLDDCLKTIDYIVNTCERKKKTAMIYLSMAFGNPYGDEWSVEKLLFWMEMLKDLGVRQIPLSNVSVDIDSQLISFIFKAVNREFQDLDIGFHLHTGSHQWKDKIEAAYSHGCRRFDTVIHGFGGCPMAAGPMLGNLDTFNLVSFMKEKALSFSLDEDSLLESGKIARRIFS